MKSPSAGLAWPEDATDPQYIPDLLSSRGAGCAGMQGDTQLAHAGPCLRHLLGRKRQVVVAAFGGSVTRGPDGGHAGGWMKQFLSATYPVLLGAELVRRGLVDHAFVRNLGVSAVQNAAASALCMEGLVDGEASGRSTSVFESTQPRSTWVNATHTTLSPAGDPHESEPLDIVIVEFSLNGVGWVDVLLGKLRERYPRAAIVYLDTMRLHPFVTGSFAKRTLGAAWSAAPACTEELGGWLRRTAAGFWSTRLEFVRRRMAYAEVASHYLSDKYHLNQKGHEMVAAGLVGALGLDAASRRPLTSRLPWARPSSRSSAEAGVGCAAGRAAPNPRAAAATGTSQGQCSLWYSSAAPSASVRPSRSAGWRYAKVSPRQAKYAWELIGTPSQANPKGERLSNSTQRTPSAELTFTLHFPADGMTLHVAHMLDCCHYGQGLVMLDGAPFAWLPRAHENMTTHLLFTSRVGVVRRRGRHTLSFREVGPGARGGRQMRIGGLVISPGSPRAAAAVGARAPSERVRETRTRK